MEYFGIDCGIIGKLNNFKTNAVESNGKIEQAKKSGFPSTSICFDGCSYDIFWLALYSAVGPHSIKPFY